MIKAIMWKEWREQRWKLAFGSVLLLFVTGSLAAAKLTTPRESYIAVTIFGGMLLALYSAMGAFAPEQANGTAGFLAARPMKPRTIFLVKWFFGWLNFVVPIILCTGMLYFLQRGESDSTFCRRVFLLMPIAGVWMSTMLYTMTCCLTPRRGGEGTVGITGLAIIIILIVHICLGQFSGYSINDESTLKNYLKAVYYFLNPWFIAMLDNRVPGWPIHCAIYLIEQVVLFSVIMMYGVRRWRRSI